MPNNFEEASAATENMFANEQTEPTTAENAGEANASPENTQKNTESQEATNASGQVTDSGNESAVLDEATQTAEIAANIASEKNAELQQVMQEMEAIKQQNQQLCSSVFHGMMQHSFSVRSFSMAKMVLCLLYPISMKLKRAFFQVFAKKSHFFCIAFGICGTARQRRPETAAKAAAMGGSG